MVAFGPPQWGVAGRLEVIRRGRGDLFLPEAKRRANLGIGSSMDETTA